MGAKLMILRSLWTNGFDLDAALAECAEGLFDGVEGPVPAAARARREFAAKLADAGVPFVAEIATGGGYVPAGTPPEAHLEDFRRIAAGTLSCSPVFVTALAGSDAWAPARSVEFLGLAMEAARVLGVDASFETHRGRPTYSPWATRHLLEQLPGLRITCDFSHWCCVCERLVLEEEPGILRLCAARARHIHARVGYPQGPQVPHPAAPEFGTALAAHERWWDAVWSAQSGPEVPTMTPEFGPDGYLHEAPFTGTPASSLDEINRWMAARQRARHARRSEGAAP